MDRLDSALQVDSARTAETPVLQGNLAHPPAEIPVQAVLLDRPVHAAQAAYLAVTVFQG